MIVGKEQKGLFLQDTDGCIGFIVPLIFTVTLIFIVPFGAFLEKWPGKGSTPKKRGKVALCHV